MCGIPCLQSAEQWEMYPPLGTIFFTSTNFRHAVVVKSFFWDIFTMKAFIKWIDACNAFEFFQFFNCVPWALLIENSSGISRSSIFKVYRLIHFMLLTACSPVASLATFSVNICRRIYGRWLAVRFWNFCYIQTEYCHIVKISCAVADRTIWRKPFACP